jgi:endoglycosylceramidase
MIGRRLVGAKLVAVVACLAVLEGCGDDGELGDAFVLRLPALQAVGDLERGGRIVDAEGREVLLRGANVNSLAEYWKGSEFPTVFPFPESDADLLAAIGWNTVRLLISWSRVEPQAGAYDEGYLDEVGRAIDVLAGRGIYSVIDLHQDAWGPTLAAGEGEQCAGGTVPALGWDGAPGWATLVGGAARCAPGGVRELSPAVLAAFEAFWDDALGPGGVGVRTRYVRMLGHVAARFANRTGVAGYDVMNEPNAFTPEALDAMGPFYSEAVAEIRAREQEVGGRSNPIFFEPWAAWSSLGQGPPPPFEHDGNVVYAPHVYTGGFTGLPITAQAFRFAVNEAQLFGGAPIFSGEWGGDPARASNPADGYFLDHMRLQDDFRFGATLWTWRESCGDPHKVGDLRAGNVPVPWGEFDVDCTTNEIIGEREDLVDQLRRAYVRAAPGVIEEAAYVPESGEFTVRGSHASLDAEVVAFYPAAKHGEPVLSSTGLADVRAEQAPGGNLYLVARTRGEQWSLRATL